MATQNVLKIDIKKDNLIFYVGEKNEKVEVRKVETIPHKYVIVGNNGEREVDLSGYGIPDSGDLFGFLLGLLSDPKLFNVVLNRDLKNLNRVILNADLDEAQVWGVIDFLILDRVLQFLGFRKLPNFEGSNVLEYVHPNGDTFEIHYTKIVKDGIPFYLIYKLEGVIKLK
jgi:hypothetical protein